MKELSRLVVECPECGYIPTGNIFLKLPLSNYNMHYRTGRLMIILCRQYGCGFEGNILQWISMD